MWGFCPSEATQCHKHRSNFFLIGEGRVGMVAPNIPNVIESADYGTVYCMVEARRIGQEGNIAAHRIT